MQLSEGRGFQTEGTVGAEVIRQAHTCINQELQGSQGWSGERGSKLVTSDEEVEVIGLESGAMHRAMGRPLGKNLSFCVSEGEREQHALV